MNLLECIVFKIKLPKKRRGKCWALIHQNHWAWRRGPFKKILAMQHTNPNWILSMKSAISRVFQHRLKNASCRMICRWLSKRSHQREIWLNRMNLSVLTLPIHLSLLIASQLRALSQRSKILPREMTRTPKTRYMGKCPALDIPSWEMSSAAMARVLMKSLIRYDLKLRNLHQPR